jgi:hypothetical protein
MRAGDFIEGEGKRPAHSGGPLTAVKNQYNQSLSYARKNSSDQSIANADCRVISTAYQGDRP